MIRSELKSPPSEFSQCPFWFWNDVMDEAEIVRQLADFQAHGVDAFVIHPRIGLPRDTGFLSPRLFHSMKVAVEEAERRGMWVILYDEGMYPSGSASGHVVASNPAFQTRGLARYAEALSEAEAQACDANLLWKGTRADGSDLWVYERKVDSVVRGLHYIGDEHAPGLGEEEPPAADLLNPEASRCFLDLVYGGFYQHLGRHFGKTIKAIFTDEPGPLGRCRERGLAPGTTGILEHVNAFLGYDFAPHLPALWFDDEPAAKRHRKDYARAISARFNEVYYRPLGQWCRDHGVALTGHPAEPDAIDQLKYFQIPGQDIVWRHIEPFQPSALEGPPSTMAKAAASAAFHLGRPRNLNEFAGAYGHELTFSELRWLASWLLIRGCNLLVPHAFYYSMRGPRKDERPPDVGPNSSWWADYKPWADFTRRVCWLNATFAPVCEVAILGRGDGLPWRAAKALFEHQIDFHYVYEDDVARATQDGPHTCIGAGRYSALIVDGDSGDSSAWPGTVIPWSEEGLPQLLKRVRPSVSLDRPAPDLRARRLRTGDGEIVLLFNEGQEVIERTLGFPGWTGNIASLDLMTGEMVDTTGSAVTARLSAGEWAAFTTGSFSAD